jgi:hypothetical protein
MEADMWQDIFDQLTSAGQGQHNFFWPEVDKEVETTMLRTLFSTAISLDIMTADELERFLSRMMAMNAAAPGYDILILPGSGIGSFSDDLYTATGELVDADEKLSPLSLLLFGKSLIPDRDRESLELDMDTLCTADNNRGGIRASA